MLSSHDFLVFFLHFEVGFHDFFFVALKFKLGPFQLTLEGSLGIFLLLQLFQALQHQIILLNFELISLPSEV
jgi:hypothetical protein